MAITDAGNATFADVVVIWARNLESKQVNAFVVKKGTPGFETTKIQNKIALRWVLYHFCNPWFLIVWHTRTGHLRRPFHFFVLLLCFLVAVKGEGTYNETERSDDAVTSWWLLCAGVFRMQVCLLPHLSRLTSHGLLCLRS